MGDRALSSAAALLVRWMQAGTAAGRGCVCNLGAIDPRKRMHTRTRYPVRRLRGVGQLHSR